MQIKNILFLVNSLHFGGAEKHVVTLLNHLDTEKITLSLACLKEGNALYSQLELNRLKSVFTCNVRSKIDFSAVKVISDYIIKEKVDIVVCTNQYPMLYGLLAKKLARYPVKVFDVFHSTLPKDLSDKFQWLFYRHAFKLCNHVIFVSENQASYWIEHRGMKTQQHSVIHNGIDTLRYAQFKLSQEEKNDLLKEHGIRSHAIMIGICAVLRPEKKHTDLVLAIHQLRSQGVDAGLLIIGDGEARKSISDYAATFPLLNNSIYFVGFQQDVRPFVELCHCMVIASHSETFSISVLESMAMAKPMVLTDIGGASEQIIHGQNGFLYQPGDIDSLVKYLKILVDPVRSKAIGEMARKRVEEHFSLATMVDKFQTLLAKSV